MTLSNLYMERRKVKNGEKSPWGQCLTRPVPNGRRRFGFWLVPEKHKFSGTNQKPERRRPFGTGLVKLSQGLFSRRSLLFFVPYIFFRPFRLSLAPLSAPGSSRMMSQWIALKKLLYLTLHFWIERVMNLDSSYSFLPFSLSLQASLPLPCHQSLVPLPIKILIKIPEIQWIKNKNHF